MTKKEYAAYLASDHWQTLRKEMLEGVEECERCEMPRWLVAIAYDQDLHVHHKNYRNLGAEEWDDLEVICRRCHEIETFGRSELKAPKTAQCELCWATHWNPRSVLCSTCDLVLCSPYLWQIHNYTHPNTGQDMGEWLIDTIKEARKATKESVEALPSGSDWFNG